MFEIKSKQLSLGSIAWMFVATLVVFIPNVPFWITAFFVLIGLVFVLGVLWAANFKIPSDGIAEYILYATGLGLAFLVIGGLALNWTLPYVGISQPLAPLPLMIFFDISAVILSLCAYSFNKKPIASFVWQSSNRTSLSLGIIPWLFVMLSIFGAEILNNGGTGTLTLVMLFGIAAYVLVLMALRTHVDGWVYISALFSISISLLFMFSLRSSHIIGWDINQEFEVFQKTLQNLRWKMSYYPGLDYNACVSITILPTIFAVLTKVPSEYVYKVIYQLLFAIVPVGVYVLARRYIKEALAFLAAFLLLSQTWFFEQMPTLIRQETAFIFYAIMLLALFDKRLTVRVRYILFSVFIVALILSHYSTAYVSIALLFGALIISYTFRLFIPSFRKEPVPIRPWMFIIAVVFLYIWQVPLTHISGTATTVVKYVAQAPVTTALPSQSGNTGESIGTKSSSSSTSVGAGTASLTKDITTIIDSALPMILFKGNSLNTEQDIIAAEKNAIYIQSGYDEYPASDTAGYAPIIVNENINVSSKLPPVISSLINFAALASKIVFIDIFPLIGLVGMYIALRRRPSLDGRYDFTFLNIGAFLLVALVILLPTLQEFYSLTRLYLQVFITLSTLAVIGGVMATSYFPRYQTKILAMLLVIIFCSFSGAFDQITGGGARITLDQPPSTLDSYYVHDTEVASAEWLAANRTPANPVQADSVSYLRLQSFADINAGNSAIFPQTIERNSYVYLTENNVIKKNAAYIYNSNLLVYNYPLNFLDAYKNLIYNNGGSRIYR